MLLALTEGFTSNPLVWLAFVAFVLVAMAVDLGLYQRKGSAAQMSTRAALTWVGIWTTLALCFNAGILYYLGKLKAEEFLAGYLLEQSLSIDNLFVFVLVFSHFKTPRAEQHRVLVWGIIGAMMLRAIMILAGSALVHRFHHVMLLFAAILLVSGFKLLFKGDDDEGDPSDSWIVKSARKVMPVTDGYRGHAFFVHEADAPGGVVRRKATLLFLVLVIIELSDVVFAVDSIPAIFGVTTDPFIVFTSNVFAILGLRSLFFVIEAAIQRLAYLKKGLAIVLIFIGVKMVLPFGYDMLGGEGKAPELPFLEKGWKISVTQSLSVIVLTLGSTAGLSLFMTRRRTTTGPSVTVTRSDSSARLLAAAGVTPEENEPKLDAPAEPRPSSPGGNSDQPPGTPPPADSGKPEVVS